jgi:L-malate glycosyltransferase
MKIVLLGSANCIHTARWANGLAARGVQVHLISAHDNTHDLDSRVQLYILNTQAPLGYFINVFEVKRLLKKLQPDLMNAHYATGYGLLARLAGFQPTLLSVWGSDVYDFPEKSFLHRWMLKGNLQAATGIGSTSHCMARKTDEIFKHPHMFITPFGIDQNRFSYKAIARPNVKLVIGTIKTLSSKYGIDTLIEAFALVVRDHTGPDQLVLEITGGGPDLKSLRALAVSLDVEKQVIFHGEVSHDRVPLLINHLDIYVALSRLESFGVAILEASACEKPVVVSDADGLQEVTVDRETGFVVPKDNPQAAADAISKLIKNETLRHQMGRAGRSHVLTHYSWDRSLDMMLDTYNKVINL